jgi:tryptophanyl-tRNA synthetase
MSKSKGNTITLFGSDEEVRKAVMGIVTDSAAPKDKKDPDANNVYNIHKLFLTKEEEETLRAKFSDGGYSYKEAKEALLAAIMKWREGKKEKFDELMNDEAKLTALLHDGAAKARTVAQKTMRQVKAQVGLDV